jgi:hypothetical protein
LINFIVDYFDAFSEVALGHALVHQHFAILEIYLAQVRLSILASALEQKTLVIDQTLSKGVNVMRISIQDIVAIANHLLL